ncbi:acyl-CoA thioesterase [Kitasatospora mediocidica]|uniref:acyl-CoA thioesterase n=1 Tax=Kitasatospora mediocidica TaxID=58352 RepID=UPI00056D5BFB|nr:thioesterase family protein [Kitasatospora mediocidica]
MSDQDFTVPITVRGYETDAQGHLNQACYLQYAEHARWAHLESAGIRQADLLAAGVGPVVLETTIKYRRELRAGDEVAVSCRFEWGTGKTFRLIQTITRTDEPDAATPTVAAELTAVSGILDLTARRLVPDPRAALGALATDPAALGI